MTKLTWNQVRAMIASNQAPFTWSVDDNSYILNLVNGTALFSCTIPISVPPSSDQTDFETNFKSLGNINPLNMASPLSTFSAKTLTVGGTVYNIYARNTGVRYVVNPGINTLTYTASYNWVKFIGIECINAAAGDYASMVVYDSVSGTYTGVSGAPLQQFGYTLNLAPNYYVKTSTFDADLFINMQLKFTYYSSSTLAKQVGLNLLMNEVSVAPRATITNPVTGLAANYNER